MPRFILHLDRDDADTSASGLPSVARQAPSFERMLGGQRLRGWLHSSNLPLHTPAERLAAPVDLLRVELPASRDRAAGVEELSPQRAEGDVFRLTILPDGAVEAAVPLIGVHSLFVRGAGKGWWISDDARALASPDDPLEPAAVYSLLQYGAVVPPFSIRQGVRRLMPGTVSRLSARTPDGPVVLPRQTARLTEFWSPGPPGDTGVSLPELRIRDRLDDDLACCCAGGGAVILYSGGVDSSLMAARARQIGLAGIRLIHYSFGDDDPETAAALGIAQELDLEVEVIRDDLDRLGPMLDRVGASYAQPISDHSCLPTYWLVQEALKTTRPGAVLLDGLGADSAYAVFEKTAEWRRLYSIPKAAGRLAGAAYGWGLWRKDGNAEYYARLLRRAATLPPLMGGLLAQNALSGILYECPAGSAAAVHGQFASWMQAHAGSFSLDQRMAVALFAHHCCDIVAQKVEPLLMGTGITAGHPFLTPECVRLAVMAGAGWPKQSTKKERLKALLEEHITQEWVHRKKSGFVAPMDRVFQHPAFVERFEQRVLTGAGPLTPHLKLDRLRLIFDKARRGDSLPGQIPYFLWNVLFATLWLEQTATTSADAVEAPPPAGR